MTVACCVKYNKSFCHNPHRSFGPVVVLCRYYIMRRVTQLSVQPLFSQPMDEFVGDRDGGDWTRAITMRLRSCALSQAGSYPWPVSVTQDRPITSWDVVPVFSMLAGTVVDASHVAAQTHRKARGLLAARLHRHVSERCEGNSLGLC